MALAVAAARFSGVVLLVVSGVVLVVVSGVVSGLISGVSMGQGLTLMTLAVGYPAADGSVGESIAGVSPYCSRAGLRLG
jgi:hypothetical protein